MDDLDGFPSTSLISSMTDALIKEDTESAVFYQTIFEMLRNKVSLREIAKSVSSDEISITHTAVGNLRESAGI